MRGTAAVVLDVLEFGAAIKKTPVVVGNCTGFAAACMLVDMGLDPYRVDKAIAAGFGMPMGPFRRAAAGPRRRVRRRRDERSRRGRRRRTRRRGAGAAARGAGPAGVLSCGALPPPLVAPRPRVPSRRATRASLPPAPSPTHPPTHHPTPTHKRRLSDLVGADVGLHVGQNFLDSFPERHARAGGRRGGGGGPPDPCSSRRRRVAPLRAAPASGPRPPAPALSTPRRCYPATIIKLLNDAKRLGEKTGAGFYKYDARRRAAPDPDIAPLVEASRRASRVAGAPPPRLSDQDILEFVFFPVVNEGCRVVDEGIVDKPADLDVATVLAMGFPPYRGGLLFWADLCGADHICRRLSSWEQQFAAAGLGGFFKPCPYLQRAAAQGRKLGAGAAQASRL
eukprot:scaffold11.g4050.t1